MNEVREMHCVYQSPDLHDALRLKELIGVHFREQRDCAFYAGLLGYSVRRMNVITRWYFGKSVYELVQDRIHEEALRLLGESRLTVRQICFELGLNDPSWFSRCFKLIEGVSPRAYRTLPRG